MKSSDCRARQDGFGARGRCDACGVEASPTILWYLEERTAGRWKRTGESTERCSEHPADREWGSGGGLHYYDRIDDLPFYFSASGDAGSRLAPPKPKRRSGYARRMAK